MKTFMRQARETAGRLGGFWMLLAMMAIGNARAADVHFDVFRFGTQTLTNATVTGKSKTDVYVSHSRGLVNVKIRDLDAATLHKLGLGPAPELLAEAKAADPGVLAVAAKSPVIEKLLNNADFSASFQRVPRPFFKFPLTILLGILAAGLVMFLFFSYCLKLIVEKSGNQPGALVWIPLLQLLPMLRAANMSGWWALGFCVPGLNLVAHVLWAINVVKIRQKNVWVTIALLLPVTNLIGFVYLAFSTADAEEGNSKKPVIHTAVPQPAVS